MVVFWALVVTAIALFIRFVARQAGSGRPGSSAQEILKQRYAKGAIGREEYVEKMKDLG